MSIISVEGVDIAMKNKIFLKIKDTYNKFNNEYKKTTVFGEGRNSNVYLDMLEERIKFYIMMN